MKKRLQNLEATTGRLSEVHEQIALLHDRKAFTSNIRIGKVVTVGTSGQTFEIDFQDGEYTSSLGATPTYVKRHPTRVWCCNVIDFLPAVDDYVLAWYINRQWWTKCGGTSGSGGVMNAVVTPYSTIVDESTELLTYVAPWDGPNGLVETGRMPENPAAPTGPNENLQPYIAWESDETNASTALIRIFTARDPLTPSLQDLIVSIWQDTSNTLPQVGDDINLYPTPISDYFITTDNTTEEYQEIDVTADIVSLITSGTGASGGGFQYFHVWIRPDLPFVDNVRQFHRIELTVYTS